LIESSKSSPITQYFIFSSTDNVIKGDKHINVKENDRPNWNMNDKAIQYWRSKAEAEKIVLGANSISLKAVSVRPCMIIGLQEHALIPAQLDALKQGKKNVQLGNNQNLLDVVSAENCANAHLLAMHALIDSSKANGKVDGEAFNITDGNPLPFWDVSRIIWRTGSDKTELKDVKVIPAWMATAMASVAEFAYGLFFFRNKIPELNRHVVNFCIKTYTCDISKAKKVLGYNPKK
jgi:sterol-4alpha-carboxylate 3-dehydrogenase (decarboxylating)